MPMVSVIVPTHNRPDMLAEALASVRAQTFTDYEIIVISNGEHPDVSQRSLAAAKQAGARYYTLDKGNVAAARNYAVEQAAGEWVAFLDDDDLWQPQKLERQLSAASAAGADMVICDYTQRRQDGGAERVFRPRRHAGWSYAKAFGAIWYTPTSGVLVRRAAVTSSGGFNPRIRLSEDIDLFRRIAWRHSICAVDETLVCQRRGHESLTWAQERRCLVWDLRGIARAWRDTPPDLRRERPPVTAALKRIASLAIPKLIRQLRHEGLRGTAVPLKWRLFALRAYDNMLKMRRREYLATTYFGARIYCDLRDFVQFYIFHFGIWEPDISSVLERNLATGDVFVDIGANIGYDTLLGAWRVGSTGRVVAIEASPRNFSLLQRNLKINQISSNVRAVNLAVSERPGKLSLFEISERNIGATTTVASRGGTLLTSIDGLPLTDILMPEERARLRLIKIDVEGAEPGILRHLLDNLSMYPETMDLVVEVAPADDPQVWGDLFDRLKAAGFAAYEIANEYDRAWYLSWRRPSPLRLIEILPGSQKDLLFTRRQPIS
jgi:FkbM family methyltransferase